MLKKTKIRSRKHRKFVSELPCAICGIEGLTQAAHIRTGNNAGMGLKSSDDCIVPLCVSCHAEQHVTSEKLFYGKRLGAAQDLAKILYQYSGNKDAALMEIARFQ